MALEDLTGAGKFISALNPAWPTDSDFLDEGDNHVRGIKNVLKNQFPNLDGAVTITDEQMNQAGAAQAPGAGAGSAWPPYLVPVGAIVDYAGGTPPTGYVVCNGQALSRATFAPLFAAIGVIWGPGDGSTTFNVPNLNGRATIGDGVNYTGIIGQFLGNVGGEASHVLSLAEMPNHQHGFKQVSGSPGGDGTSPSAGYNGVLGLTDAAGGGGAHNNIQPSAVVLKLIKV